MRRKIHLFTSADELDDLITQYFIYIDGEYHLEQKEIKNAKGTEITEQKIWTREPEPATIAGLALYLGFNSRQAFEEYETNGKFADTVKRARLRVEAAYEKKLHFQSPTGAIFALKNMGWNERAENKTIGETANTALKIKIIQTGPPLVSSEKEVTL